MAEKVTPDIINPPCHELSNNIQHELNAILKEYESQFTKDETSIGTTPLTSMMIDTGTIYICANNKSPHNHQTDVRTRSRTAAKNLIINRKHPKSSGVLHNQYLLQLPRKILCAVGGCCYGVSLKPHSDKPVHGKLCR